MAQPLESLPEPLNPHFIFDDALPDEDRAALEMVRNVAHHHPDFAEESLGVYTTNPEVVGNVLDFLYAHPEGVSTLHAWRHIMSKRLDFEVEFDPATEDAIANDAYFRSVKRDFDERPNVEEFRTKMRQRRWKVFFDRIRAA